MLTLFLLLAAFNADDSQAILQAEKQWMAAIQKPDAAALEKLLHIQLIYGHSTGVTDSKASYIGKVATGQQKYAGVEQEIVKMQQLAPDTYLVHAKMHMWGTNQNGKFDDRLMLMQTWIKRDGRWQLAAHQTAKLPQ